MPLGMRGGGIVINRDGGVAYPHQVWVATDDDRKLATYGLDSTQRPIPRFSWVQENGIFVKGRYARPETEGPTDNPVSVYSGNPTQASDLTIADFSDPFDDDSLAGQWAIGGHSGGTVAEQNSRLEITPPFATDAFRWKYIYVLFSPALSGDFEITVDVAHLSFSGSYNPNGSRTPGCTILDASNSEIAYGGNTYYRAGTGGVQHYWGGEFAPGTPGNTVSTSANSGTYRHRRVSGTWYIDFNQGSGWVNIISTSKSTAVGGVRLTASASRLTAAPSFYFANLSITV